MSLIERLATQLVPAGAATVAGPERRAAVAVLIHDLATTPRVLLMKRAERAGDPWSGHISLPGGRHEQADPDLLTTAIRETREELGLELGQARVLGKLAPLHPRSSGPLGIEVTPFVFTTTAPVAPRCGPEAIAAFWLPLEAAASGALDGTYLYPGTDLRFPSWTFEGHVIWGLTWRILSDVLAIGSPTAARSG